MYARLCLALQNRFSSKHALALWELCVDYLGSGRDYGETPYIPLAEYREMMGVGKDGYPKFRDFNQRVVKEPVAEINRVSDFLVSVDYQRQGRKVTALKFRIRRVALLPEAGHRAREAVPRPGRHAPGREAAQGCWPVLKRCLGYLPTGAGPSWSMK